MHNAPWPRISSEVDGFSRPYRWRSSTSYKGISKRLQSVDLDILPLFEASSNLSLDMCREVLVSSWEP